MRINWQGIENDSYWEFYNQRIKSLKNINILWVFMWHNNNINVHGMTKVR